MKRVQKRRVAVLAAIALLASAAWVVQSALLTKDDGKAKGGGATPVHAARAGIDIFVDKIEAVGTTHSNESVVLTANVTETVGKINFDDGARVEEGAILVELVSAEERAMLRSARAKLLEAQQQFDRIDRLVRRGNLPTSKLDEQTYLRDQAKAEIESIEAQIADRVIRAPFGGVLGMRRISSGAVVRAGDAIVTIDDVSVIKLDFTVPETFLAALAEGQEIAATSAAFPDRAFAGTIATIESRIDPVTRSVTVRALIPNEGRLLRPGMLMTVDVVKSREATLVIPEEALVPVRDQQYVFTIDDQNKARRTEIRIGRRRPGSVEVLDGLEAGQLVVTEGTIRMRDGATVEVLNVREPAASAAGPAD